MKIKTAELSGKALDFAVAESLGAYIGMVKPYINTDREEEALIFPDNVPFQWAHGVFAPSTRWGHCGPLIEGYSPVITICQAKIRTEIATLENDVAKTGVGLALTYLESFCRALVSLKLGDEVDIPDELTGDV